MVYPKAWDIRSWQLSIKGIVHLEIKCYFLIFRLFLTCMFLIYPWNAKQELSIELFSIEVKKKAFTWINFWCVSFKQIILYNFNRLTISRCLSMLVNISKYFKTWQTNFKTFKMYFNVKLLILNDYKEAVMKETVIVLYSLSNLNIFLVI